MNAHLIDPSNINNIKCILHISLNQSSLIQIIHRTNYLMHLIDASSVEKYSLCQGCLTRVNVSRDSNISDVINIFKFLQY